MLSRAVALVREHPLLTPLLVVYTTVSLIAAIFGYLFYRTRLIDPG